MIAGLLLADAPAGIGLLVRATLLMATAWMGAAVLRKTGASAATRHAAWLLCFVALLALPLVRWLVPTLQLPLLPPEAVLPAELGSRMPAELAASGHALGGALRPNPPEQGWSILIPAAYALGAAALLVRLAAGRWILARLWRNAEPADEAWKRLLSGLAREMRLPPRVELRIARAPVMPMTWGTLSPRLLLAPDASHWPLEQRRLVLLHELAHVARRDSLSRSAASLACALYWFHPGVWFAARRMRMEQEHAADDRVLTGGGSPHAYARSLLQVARAMGERRQPDFAATIVGTCPLERRLVSITGPARRDRPTAIFLYSSAILATLATLVAAVAVPVRASPARFSLAGSAPALAPPAKKPTDPATEVRADSVGLAAVRAVEMPSTHAYAQDSLEPAAAASSHLERRASAARPSAQMLRARREETAPRDGGLPDPEGDAAGARPQAPAFAQPLPVYGWALRRGELKMPVESASAPSKRVRLRLPTQLPVSNEQAGGPKWARFLPRLTRRDASSRSLPLTSDRTLMLSLSTSRSAP